MLKVSRLPLVSPGVRLALLTCHVSGATGASCSQSKPMSDFQPAALQTENMSRYSQGRTDRTPGLQKSNELGGGRSGV